VKNRTRVTAEMGFDQTLVIAGGTQHQESDVRSGVPGLQRVPVLQYFFGTRGRSETQSSLLVLLTPRRPAVSEVVTSADQMAADLRRRRCSVDIARAIRYRGIAMHGGRKRGRCPPGLKESVCGGRR